MIESMTGFVSHTFDLFVGAAGQEKKISLVAELKSLNSRYFETTFRLPSSLASLELPLTSLCKKKLLRGKVFCAIKSHGADMLLESYMPVHAVIEQYVNAARDISKAYGLTDDLSVAHVLAAPGAFVPVTPEMTESQEQAFFGAIEKALHGLQSMRLAEGALLFKDLVARLQMCRDRISLIAAAFEVFFEAKKVELAKHRELCVDLIKMQEDPGLKLKLDELHAVVHRGDIHEELVRFNAHILAFDGLLNDRSSEEKGRRFDFMLQEMHREINTVTSKSSLPEISKAAIDIKCELEKIREQIQNVV